MNCLTENTIVQFVHDGLAAPERAVAELHLDSCADCLRAMAETAKYLFQDGSELVTLPARASSATLAAGDEIARYVVDQPIGSGGMGVVYAAYDPQLDRKVALKLLHHVHGADAASQTRLLHEAQAMARLSHPNVVAVHDAGEHDGRVFVAMELIDGKTLADWLASESRSWRAVVDVFVAAGRGLAAAHVAGLVHRDFKPQNVLIGGDGRARVTDFGLARSYFESALATPASRGSQPLIEAMTQTGSLAGTPAYMAPEQFAQQPANARTDQFSFCVAFYEALYGERPFPGETLVQLAESVTSGTLRGRRRSSAVPEWLHAILVRGLALAPEKRFPSLDTLLEEIHGHLSRPRGRRKWFAAIAVSAVVFTGIIIATAMRRAPTPEPGPAARGPAAAPADLKPDLAAPYPAPALSVATGESGVAYTAASAPPIVVRATPAPAKPSQTVKKRAKPRPQRKPAQSSSSANEDAPLSPWEPQR